MAVDLNKLAEKLKEQRTIGVTRDGRLTEQNPANAIVRPDNDDSTTSLEPKRFFVL